MKELRFEIKGAILRSAEISAKRYFSAAEAIKDNVFIRILIEHWENCYAQKLELIKRFETPKEALDFLEGLKDGQDILYNIKGRALANIDDSNKRALANIDDSNNEWVETFLVEEMTQDKTEGSLFK